VSSRRPRLKGDGPAGSGAVPLSQRGVVARTRTDERERSSDSEAHEPPHAATYDAFVSYSHGLDTALAVALERGLKRLARPWYRREALRIFRDDTNLAANPALWSSIETALSQARFFILLASPVSAKSEWVTREAEWWLTNRPLERVLIVLTDGKLRSPQSTHGLQEGTLPASLHAALVQEPRFVDMRWARGRDLSLEDPDFRAAVADLAAPVHGIPKAELVDEDVRQHRRTLRLVRATAVAMFALAVGAGVAAWWAVQQRNDAIDQAHRAMSRSLALESAANLDRATDAALLFALESYRMEPSFQARNAMMTAIERAGPRTTVFPRSDTGPLAALSLATDGHRALASPYVGKPRLFDASEQRVQVLPWSVNDAQASNGRIVVSVHDRDRADAWNLTRGPRLTQSLELRGVSRGQFLTLSPNGRRLAAQTLGGKVRIFDLSPRRGARGPTTEISDRVGDLSASAALTDAGTWLAMTSSGRGAFLWDLSARPARRHTLQAPPRRYPVQAGDVPPALAFTDRGHFLQAVYADGWVRRWRVTRGGRPHLEQTRVINPGRRQGSAVAVSPDGRVAAYANDDDTLTVIREVNRHRVHRFTIRATPFIETLAIAADGKSLASATDGGLVEIWDISDRPFARTLPVRDAAGVAFTRGDALLAIGRPGAIELWTIDESARSTAHLALPGEPDVASRVMATGPDGRTLISLDSPSLGGLDVVIPDGRVLTWDLRRHELVRMRRIPLNVNFGSGDVALSFDAGTLAYAGDRGVEVWDVRQWHRRARLPVRLDTTVGAASGLAVDGDGTTLAAVTHEQTRVEIWDIEKRKRSAMVRLSGSDAAPVVAWSRDGATLAVGDGGRIFLWNARDRRLAGAPIVDADAQQVPMVFSPNGRTLVSAGAGRLQFYDVAAHHVMGEPIPLPSDDHVVAYSPTGSMLATAGPSSDVILWDPLLWTGNLDSFTRRVCKIVRRNLTTTEWKESLPGEPYRPSCPRFDR
jgi:WD40 repeat protein